MNSLYKSSFIFICLAISLTFHSCEKVLMSESVVYSNDFDGNDFSNLTSSNVIEFNNTGVLGSFNNEGFKLSLNSLPDHNYIVVSFDLYIHDSWDGNTNELSPPGEDHDAWIMEFDPEEKRKISEQVYFETTFSNGECQPARCLDQSYPNVFPFVRNPRTNSTGINLPGLCSLVNNPSGTSLYRVSKIYRHERSLLTISFYDKLLQTNSPDPKCDESWSLDNLTVTVQTIE